MILAQNGTEGRVYGGDPNLIHIAYDNPRRIGAVSESKQYLDAFWAFIKDKEEAL